MHSRFVVCPVHIGRAAELQAVEAAIAGAGEGAGRTVLICGEAGVGKSRLTSEAATLAGARGFTVIAGPCLEGSTAPYAPIATALRRHVRRLEPEAVHRLFDGQARLAVTLLPEVAAEVGAIATAPNLSPEDLDAAVWHVLARATAERPVLLLIDDLHNAGADMLRLFSSLACESGELRLCVVGTYRSDELHRNHPLTAALASLMRERRYEEVRLEPLDRAALATMLGAIFDGIEVGDDFLEAIHARTGGNPFFVEELCRVLLERGDVFLQGSDWTRKDLADIELPATIASALLARTRHIPVDSLAALRVAAVAGEVVDARVLAHATGCDDATTRRHIADGVEYQVLGERRDDQSVQFAFLHNLTRELLAHDLVGPERHEAHRRIAQGLRAVHADDLDTVAGAIADHHQDAGELLDAAAFARTAARHACAMRAPDLSIARYQQAIRLTPKRDPARLELLLEAAENTVDAADRRAAVSFASEARSLAERSSQTVEVARAIRVLAQARWWAGDGEGAVDLAREVMSLVEGRGDTWELWGLVYLSRRCALLDNEIEARTLVERALPMAIALDDHVMQSRLHDTLAVLGGDEKTVAAEWTAALVAARAADDEAQETMVLSNSGYVALWHGDLAVARERFGQAMELSTRLISPFEGHAGVGLGWVQALSGELDDALVTVARHQRTSDLPNTLDALTAIGEAQTRRGMAAAARQVAEEHWRLAQSTGENQTLVPALAALARAMAREDLHMARPLFDEAMERARQGASARQLHWTFTPDMARALAVAGETAELRRWADSVASLTTGSADHPHNRSASRLCEGLALLAERRHDEAAVRLEEAAAMYAMLPCPAREIEARLSLAEAHLGRGEVPAAVEVASAAQRLAGDHGIEQLMPEVMAMLRRAGVRVAGRRGVAAAELPGGLSERELQVAALVAQGLSNAEIGRRLFLSELTVRNHVSNVLAKLELRTRAEVARWMAENGLLDAVDARPGR